jgi:MFS family permease
MAQVRSSLPLGPGLLIQLYGLGCLSMGNAVLLPVLGPVGREVGLTEAEIGILFSLAALAAFVCAPFWGRKSDTIGQARVYTISIAGFCASLVITYVALFFGLSGTLGTAACFWVLLLGRLIYAGFASGALPAVSQRIAASSQEQTRLAAMSRTGIAFGVGSLGGAALTMVAAGPLGPLSPLLIAGLLSLCALFPTSTMAQPRPLSDATASHDDRVLPHNAIALLLIAFFSSTSLAIVQSITPFLVQDFGNLSLSKTASVAAGLGFIHSVSTLLTLWAVSHHDGTGRTVLISGSVLISTATVVLIWSIGFAGLIVAHLVLGVGAGLLFPSLQSTVSRSVPATDQGYAAGLLSAATTGGYVAGPLIGGLMYSVSGTVALIASSITGVFCLVVALRIVSFPSLGKSRR